VLQFTGYLVQEAIVQDASRPERVQVSLPCQDGFWRLEKKYWLDLDCFEGYTLEEMFHRVLHHCSVPDANISVPAAAADVSLDPDPSPERVGSKIGGDPRWDFPEDTGVIEGLNRIIADVGWEWGVKQTGAFFLREPLTYTDGDESWTLDDDSADEDDYVYSLRADTHFDDTTDGQPWVNYVFVRLDRGGEEDMALVYDWDPADYTRSLSHHDTTAGNFVGEDFWHVFVGYDEKSAIQLAYEILGHRAGDAHLTTPQRASRQRILHFRANSQPGLFPDEWVKVQATGLNIPTDSIFQIVNKSWSTAAEPEGDGSITFDYEANWVK
jgi:hypothetical protein